MNAEQEAVTVAQVRSWLRTGRAKAIRRRAGISQAEAALAVGTDGPQISRWETGKSVPYRDSALKLARLYNQLEEIIRDETTREAGQGKTAGAA